MHLCNQELLNNPSAICVYQDYERSTATKYARKMGLHQHHTSLGQPRFHLIPSDSFEEADDYVKAYWKSGIYPSLWVCDSIPAMVPQAMFNRETDDNPQIALQARLLADLLARWVKIAADYGTTFLLINQIRAYISTSFMDKGKAIPGLAGSEKETTPGGNAIKFYASMRLDLRPKSVVQAKSYNPMTGDIENVPIANLVKATTKKNKCGNPYRSGVFYISFGEGIDTVRTMLDLALRKGVIVKEGSGRLNLTLPTGESIIADQAEFINQVKNGPQAKKFQDYLYKALQWDRATEITEEILGLEIEDAETGERSSQGTLTGSATAGKLQLVKAQIDLLMQADALDLLKKSGRAITWTNPNTKEEFRGGNHDSLGKKIKGADRQVLQSQVEAEVKKLEEMLEAAKPKDDAAEAAPSRQNSPPVENSVAALFSAEAEQLNSTSSNNETGNPPFQAEEEPE
jgi:RecA/RadA recombinase